MKTYSPMKKQWSLVATLLMALSTAASANPASPTVCMTLPKAQLGQGNGASADVAEPVRQALMSYLEGPMIEAVAVAVGDGVTAK